MHSLTAIATSVIRVTRGGVSAATNAMIPIAARTGAGACTGTTGGAGCGSGTE